MQGSTISQLMERRGDRMASPKLWFTTPQESSSTVLILKSSIVYQNQSGDGSMKRNILLISTWSKSRLYMCRIYNFNHL